MNVPVAERPIADRTLAERALAAPRPTPVSPVPAESRRLPRWLLFVALGCAAGAAWWLAGGTALTERARLAVANAFQSTASSEAQPTEETPKKGHPAPTKIAGKGEIDVEGGVLKLAPRAFGEVVEILAQENVHVAANAPLLRIDDDLVKLSVQQAEQALAEAKLRADQARRVPDELRRSKELLDKQVEAAQLALGAAQRTYTDIQGLRDQVSANSLKTAKDVVSGRKTALDAEILKREKLDAEKPDEAVRLADIAFENAKTRLAQANRQLDQYTLRSRMPGRVLKVFVGIGESFGPAAREPAVLFCPDKPFIVRCEIEQEFAGQVKPGMKAVVLDDVSGERIGEAEVERCSDVFTYRRQPVDDARLHNDFRTMECVLKLLSGSERVRIGQHVRVVIGG